MTYAYSENYILPLSHDEVVHGKKSLIGRMPGDIWRQFAGTRLLAMYLILQRGAGVVYYGEEIGMQSKDFPRKEIQDPVGKRYWPIEKGRDGERRPMQWDCSEKWASQKQNHGLSPTTRRTGGTAPSKTRRPTSRAFSISTGL